MKDKERDYLDDLFREKLYNFEAEPDAADWQAIADRLPQAKSVPLRRAWRYWAAAAAVLLATVVGGLYLSAPRQAEPPLAEAVAPDETPTAAPELPAEETEEVTALAEAAAPRMAAARVASAKRRTVQETAPMVRTRALARSLEAPAAPRMKATAQRAAVGAPQTRSYAAETPLLASADLAVRQPEARKAPRSRRWSFGMGAGSVSAGTNNQLGVNSLKSTSVLDMELSKLNSPYFNEDNQKADIEHKTPVSIGLGVSYALNDRFSLQSGVTYTYLASEWERGSIYVGTTKQKLHFIGIPLSLNYKIAEWKRVQFYAAAGAMTEVNVAGKLESKIMADGDELRRQREHIRMKEWLWSVSGRVGAAYPLWRFVSVYAEAGVGYYFDNGSDIETIRSEKPFNVSLQAGFRLGF